jgi:quercetin dioxygenase-like cupin family protein
MAVSGNENFMGRSLELKDLAEYQDGSVVSRTLIDKKVGNVTLFAFDEGQGLSEHTAPYDAFLYVFDGDAEVTISGRSHALSSGQMIIMPAGKPHAVHASRRFKMMLVMIRS